MIPFADYEPDSDSFEAAHVAKNVLPGKNCYFPMPSTVRYSTSALPSRYMGGTFVRSQAGVAYNFVGTAAKLYRLNGLGFTEMTRSSGGDYSVAADDRWEFVLWGNQLLALNIADDIQVVTLGGANFAALSGSPPKAKHAAIFSDDFVMLGNIVDAVDGAQHSRVHWCAYRDITDWTPDTETQCDFRDLEATDGAVQRLIGGENGLAFQDRRISHVSLIGSPYVFQFARLTNGIGTNAPRSVVTRGQDVFFLGQEGFAVMAGGTQYQRIGENRVDRTFFNDIKPDHYSSIVGVAQKKTGRIWWAYAGSGSSNGIPNKQLIYDPSLNKWSSGDLVLEGFQFAAASGIDSDSIDATYANSDLANIPMDSDLWAGGIEEFASFDAQHYLQFHNGPPLPAELETAEVELYRGRHAWVNEARPIGEAFNSILLQVMSRDARALGSSITPNKSLNSYGVFDLNANAVYHKFVCQVTGQWDRMLGLDVVAKQGEYR